MASFYSIPTVMSLLAVKPSKPVSHTAGAISPKCEPSYQSIRGNPLLTRPSGGSPSPNSMPFSSRPLSSLACGSIRAVSVSTLDPFVAHARLAVGHDAHVNALIEKHYLVQMVGSVITMIVDESNPQHIVEALAIDHILMTTTEVSRLFTSGSGSTLTDNILAPGVRKHVAFGTATGGSRLLSLGHGGRCSNTLPYPLRQPVCLVSRIDIVLPRPHLVLHRSPVTQPAVTDMDPNERDSVMRQRRNA